MLDAEGKTLRELNELVGQTSQFELQSITNVHAKGIMVGNYRVETGQEEQASLPNSVEFKHLRRSARLPSKRAYENMQMPNTRTGRLVKRPRLAANESFNDILPTNGPSKEPVTDGSTSETLGEAPEAPSESSTTALPLVQAAALGSSRGCAASRPLGRSDRTSDS